MRTKQRAERDHIAQRRLVAATEKLTAALDLPKELTARVQVQRGEPDVRAMKQREGLADVLEAVAAEVDKRLALAAPKAPRKRVAKKGK